jgi:hypothetical protein
MHRLAIEQVIGRQLTGYTGRILAKMIDDVVHCLYGSACTGQPNLK